MTIRAGDSLMLKSGFVVTALSGSMVEQEWDGQKIRNVETVEVEAPYGEDIIPVEEILAN